MPASRVINCSSPCCDARYEGSAGEHGGGVLKDVAFMEYRRLGKSGLKVSEIALGCGSTGFVGRADEIGGK